MSKSEIKDRIKTLWAFRHFHDVGAYTKNAIREHIRSLRPKKQKRQRFSALA